MPRYRLDIAYNGLHYRGWQKQDDADTVQGKIEWALSQLHSHQVHIMGAGRTDSGVHARHQVAHFDLAQLMDEPQGLISRLNRMLPEDIHIWNCTKVPDEFHARFDAVSRSYEYHIITKFNPISLESAWLVEDELDLSMMNECADSLLGMHDFTSFSKKNVQLDHSRCAILQASWSESDNGMVFEISANRFLHHMVRSLVGEMVQVGKGEKSVENFTRLLVSPYRKDIGKIAPAKGLVLNEVEYLKTASSHS